MTMRMIGPDTLPIPFKLVIMEVPEINKERKHHNWIGYGALG